MNLTEHKRLLSALALIGGLATALSLLLLLSRPPERIAAGQIASALPQASNSGVEMDAVVPAAGEWQFEVPLGVVDPHVSDEHSLRLDAAGRPHIVHGGKYLFHTWYDGSTWSTETVDSSPLTGGYASLAFDSAERPHIAYRDALSESLKYAYRDDSVWRITVVDAVPYGATHIALALDPLDYPHISYRTTSPSWAVKYANLDATGWHTTTVDTASGKYIGENSSIAVDVTAPYTVHITYLDATNWDLKYAYKITATWNITTLDSLGSTGSQPSLALGGDGNLNVAYWGSSGLTFGRLDASGWHASVVDSRYRGMSNSDSLISLALAPTAPYTPNVAYYAAALDKDLLYAHQITSSWSIATVDSAGDVGASPSLALDRNGNPHMSYYDTTNSTLKYAYWDRTAWQFQAVVVGSRPGGSDSRMALDGQGQPRMMYLSLTPDGMYDWGYTYAYRDSSGWHGELLPLTTTSFSTNNDLAVDSQDNPHVIIREYPTAPFESNRLSYWRRDANGWTSEQLPAPIDGEFPSLAIDDNGYPHIAYAKFPLYWSEGLHYAYKDISGWQVITVEVGRVGIFTSLVLRNGYARITYFDDYFKDLKYIQQTGSG